MRLLFITLSLFALASAGKSKGSPAGGRAKSAEDDHLRRIAESRAARKEDKGRQNGDNKRERARLRMTARKQAAEVLGDRKLFKV